MDTDYRAATPEMQAAWRKVFVTDQPGLRYPSTLAFRYPFTERIERAMILYPTAWHLEESQFRAICQTLRALGSSIFYTSIYEDKGDFLYSGGVRGDARHHILKAEDSFAMHEASVPWPLEYALYGDAPCWGLIASHELHAILGGSTEFIEKFKSFYPNWAVDVGALKYFWVGNDNRAWLDELLPKVEGGLEIVPAPLPDDE
jgi:hypothetical protein